MGNHAFTFIAVLLVAVAACADRDAVAPPENGSAVPIFGHKPNHPDGEAAAAWGAQHDISSIRAGGQGNNTPPKVIVWSSRNPNDRAELFSPPKSRRPAACVPQLFNPSWSPNQVPVGVIFAYHRCDGPSGIYLVTRNDADGSANAPVFLFPTGYVAPDPKWSLDGRRIAYTEIPPDGSFDVFLNEQQPDGSFGPPINVSNSGPCFLTATPRWSPDSRRLLAAKEPTDIIDPNCPEGPGGIVVYDIDPDANGTLEGDVREYTITGFQQLPANFGGNGDWARTENKLVAPAAVAGSNSDLWVAILRFTPEGQPEVVEECPLLVSTPDAENFPKWGPEDAYIIYLVSSAAGTVVRRADLVNPFGECPAVDAIRDLGSTADLGVQGPNSSSGFNTKLVSEP